MNLEIVGAVAFVLLTFLVLQIARMRSIRSEEEKKLSIVHNNPSIIGADNTNTRETADKVGTLPEIQAEKEKVERS